MTILYQKPLNLLYHPLTRYIYASVYTAVLLIVLLQSSSQPVVGPAAPPGPPPLEREIMLTIGHVIGFSLLPLLWWWALKTTFTRSQALLLAVMMALVIGTYTEIAQANIPDRSSSWFDLTVNWCVTLATTWSIWRYR